MTGLRFGPISPDAVHLCVDMQRLFAEDTDWRTPWMPRVLPIVVRLCEHRPERTRFTCFIPARSPETANGAWARYWRKWSALTLDRLDPELIALVPELQGFGTPVRLVDKTTYSPWIGTDLHASLEAARVDTLVVSGAETDVCVLASVLGAVDLGYRVIVAADAVCSSSDSTHDSLIGLYHQRFGQQIETANTGEIIDGWR